MTKKELFEKELSNMYAIAKQVNTYFHGSDISFLTDKTQRILSDYVKFSCGNEEETAQTLRDIKVNPGNTVDSIVQEITENLGDIAKSDINDPTKELSYQLSLNRLISYHMANVENLQFLQRQL